jgi:SEC-C motif-containing protein
MNPQVDNCPCGSGKLYDSCCGLYHSGEELPRTAEELMRARYSAFAVGNMDFISSTHDPRTMESYDEEQTRDWARESEWLGLEICHTQYGLESDDTGIVEFIAKYRQQGQEHRHHEEGRFRKQSGKWYFSDGQMVLRPIVRSSQKIGRNDPCPCGSGKKYKKCCIDK